MFRWLIVCALLCGGAFYLVSRVVPPTHPSALGNEAPYAKKSEGNSSNSPGGELDIKPLPFTLRTDRKNGHNLVIIPGARIVSHEKQEVGSDRDGLIVFYGTPVPPGEEKTVPPSRLI